MATTKPNAAMTVDSLVVFAPTSNNRKPQRVSVTAAVMATMLANMEENGATSERTELVKLLEKEYSGAVPAADHETLVSVAVSNKIYAELLATVDRLGFPKAHDSEMVDDQPTKADLARAVRSMKAAGRSARATRSVSGYPVGVVNEDGSITERATWQPGHDARYKGVLIGRMKEGNAEAAAEMVARGWLTQPQVDERMATYADLRENAQARAQAKEQAKADREAKKQARLQARLEKEAAKAQAAQVEAEAVTEEPTTA